MSIDPQFVARRDPLSDRPKGRSMPDRPQRLAQFISDRKPAVDETVQVLCEDRNGAYTLPFPCLWSASAWINVTTAQPIEAEVVGWRPQPAPFRRAPGVATRT